MTNKNNSKAAAAPAAGTAVQMPAMPKAKLLYGSGIDGLRPLYAEQQVEQYAQAYGDARAEEARREARAEFEAKWTRHQEAVDGLNAAAQRTAGGDAVAKAIDDLIRAWAPANANDHDAQQERMRARSVLESLVAAKPVEEAAAQADGAEMAELRKQASAMSALIIEAHDGITNGKPMPADFPARWDAATAPTAQPTPPDDERAAFEKWTELSEGALRGTQHDVIGWYFFDHETQGLWECWQEATRRAALRQPGALGDEEDARLLKLFYHGELFNVPLPLRAMHKLGAVQINDIFEDQHLGALGASRITAWALDGWIIREKISNDGNILRAVRTEPKEPT